MQLEEEGSKDEDEDGDEDSGDDSGSDSDVSVVSDEDVPSSKIKQLVSDDKRSNKRMKL